MCRPVVAVILTCLLPAPLAAQSAAGWMDSTLRLTAELRAVRDSADRADSRLREAARRSGLVASASPQLLEAAREVLAAFDSARQKWFGRELPSPHGFRIVFRNERPQQRFSPPQETQALAIAGLPDTGDAARVSPLVPNRLLNDRESLLRDLLHYFGILMLPQSGAAIQRWLPTGLPFTLSDTARRQEAMYALATGVGAAQRGCVLGDLNDCGYALGLRTSARDNPQGQYYPLVRADLLVTALELGGEGAWARLREATGDSVLERLAAAAKLPADSLLATWRTGLLALRPERNPIRARGVAVLIGWTVLTGLVALLGARQS